MKSYRSGVLNLNRGFIPSVDLKIYVIRRKFDVIGVA